MSQEPQEGSVESNVAKGRGIVKKDGFKTVGVDESDRNHPEITGETGRGRGRPAKDKNFKVVGPDASGEQGTKKSD